MYPYNRAKVEQLLEDYGIVGIFVDVRYKDVQLPVDVVEKVCMNPRSSEERGIVHLQVDPKLVQDMIITDWGWRGTLVFSGERFQVSFPYNAIIDVGCYYYSKQPSSEKPYSVGNVVHVNFRNRPKIG